MPDETDSKLGALIVIGVPDPNQSAAPIASALPLRHTAVTAQISGLIALVTVSQTFENPFTERIALDYRFPLPHEAAITAFALHIGDRTVRATLREIETARAAYQQAIDAGQRAGLLEERRPNLFSIQIGNVAPGEPITAELHYQQRIGYADDRAEFVFPMGVTPKFHANSAEAQAVDSPVAAPGERIGTVALNVTIDAGVPVGDPASPSHAIQVERVDPNRLTIGLPDGTIPSKDFVLRYPIAAGTMQPIVRLSHGADADTALITLLPPRLETAGEPPPREFIFVIDRSGSMSGAPIEQAKNALKACLRTLSPQDSFLIQAFDTVIEWAALDNGQPAAQPITQETVEMADRWLATIDARGGTNIIGAINAALAIPVDGSRQRYVMFLTDGAVSADAQALAQIRQQRGAARIFTFGIGPSVNRSLLAEMAGIGHGTAQYLQLTEDIEAAISTFQDQVSYPALLDIELIWQGVQVWDTYPTPLPDLYIGQAIQLSMRLRREPGIAEPALIIRGRRGSAIETYPVALPTADSADPVVERLWARARVDDLIDEAGTDDKIRQQVIGLAIDHQLLTPLTAFVAIDSEATPAEGESGAPQKVQVSIPLPAGLNLTGFFGAAPGSMPRGGYAAPSVGAAPPSPAMPARNSGATLLQRISKSSSAQPPAQAAPPSPIVRTPPTQAVRTLYAHDPRLADVARRTPEDLLPPDWDAPGTSIDDRVKWLVRTQNINGSWLNEVEPTAAALLALIRAGHTTRIGIYKTSVRKALQWLQNAPAGGFAAFARWRALLELEYAESAANGAYLLPALNVGEPTTGPEQAAIDPAMAVPNPITSLDDLRIAALNAGAVADFPMPADPAKRQIARYWLAVGAIGNIP